MKKELAIFIMILSLASLALPVAFAVDIEVGEACGLAEAIEAANSDEPVGACPAGAGDDSIRLTGDATLADALPPIASAIAIEGGGFTLDGDGNRIFHVSGEGELHITELTLTGGRADEDSAACLAPATDAELDEAEASEETDEPEPAGYGGAICIDGGIVSVSASRFSDNWAGGGGGAIAIFGGMLEIAESQFSDNSAGEHGGALYSEGGSVDLKRTAFRDNQATEYGGAIDNIAGARLVIAESEFTGNQATTGGAIGNWQSRLSVTGSRFEANEAERGGAIQSVDGEPEICQSAFSDNVAETVGAAIYNARGRLAAADNDFSGNRAGEGGVIHIIEPEAATLALSANRFSDNDDEDCAGCDDAEREAYDCGAEAD